MDDKNYFLDEDEDFIEVSPSNDSQTEESDELTIFDETPIQDEKNEPNTSEIEINSKTEDKKITNRLPKNDLLKQTFSQIKDRAKEIKPRKLGNYLYDHGKLLPVVAFLFVSVLGIYIFINNVNADIINLIKIEEKQKVGYINDEGNVIVRPKFIYGTDYYKGFAIVKNYNNLYGVIDGKGNNEISFGNIFSANLYGNRYIVTKFTNDGLKMGLLDSSLKEVTRFKYDSLAYSKSGIFMYTINDTMGIMNNDGKEIYSYKVDEVDDRNISVEVSTLTEKSSSDVYAKIKINSSSTIINTKTGKEVYKYTLDDIRVLDNNVFYVKNQNGNNKYFIIKNDKIVYETTQYKRVRVEDLDSDIAIAIKDDASIDYINLLTKEKINKDGNIKYTYSDGIVRQEIYDFSTSKNEFTVITPKKNLATFYDVNTVDNIYVNGYMKINTDNNKYNFLNKKGETISKKEYEEASDFNKNGYAIVSNDNEYGVIDGNGKEIIDLKYDEIKFFDDTLFSNISKKTNQELFIFKDNNKYGIINANGKVVVKAIYDEFKTITIKYPIIKAKYNNETILLNLENFKDLGINASKTIQVYEDYIVSGDNYYNYDGELIYTIGG